MIVSGCQPGEMRWLKVWKTGKGQQEVEEIEIDGKRLRRCNRCEEEEEVSEGRTGRG